ncbi:MAG: DUF1949 domain-containing protein, partial [Oscillospiraceae bacterium]|nr:DUF1949 domain-containing protein [Oscillospiraceae bacterium]
LNTDYAENVTVKMLVKKDFVQPLAEKLTDITNGSVSIVQGDEYYDNFA